jgi:type II secretory pathway pseudopilin PulG
MIFIKKTHATRRGMTFLEICVAMAISILIGAGLLAGLTQCLSFAASGRLLTNARAIVHRNIDAAGGVAFTSTSSIPTILATTGSAWTVCEDDGATTTGTTVENIQLSGSNNTVLVTGTLRRMVAQETASESASAQIYRITFKVDYTFLSKSFSYSETTLRSIDNN